MDDWRLRARCAGWEKGWMQDGTAGGEWQSSGCRCECVRLIVARCGSQSFGILGRFARNVIAHSSVFALGEGVIHGNHKYTAACFILRWWHGLPGLVSGAWGFRARDYDRQVLLHHLPVAAAFFRIPQSNFVLKG